MPKVNIEGVGVVEFPEGYTPDRIKFAIENDILPRLKKADGMPQVEVNGPKAEKPNALVRFGRGMEDIRQGVTQLGMMAKDAVTGGNEADQYTKEKTDELLTYERGRGPNAGTDWWRLGGNIVATLPAAAIPGGASASMAGRIASGAAQGATGGVAMFAPDGDSKTSQAVLGGLFGGAFPVAAAGVQKVFSSMAEKFRGVPVVDTGILATELEKQLKGQGIEYKKLTREVQTSLLEDAQKAINTGGKLSPEQLARKADIESVGAKGTQASITRSPKDWQQMTELRGVRGVGEDIIKRQQDDSTAMVEYLNRLRGQTGGQAATAQEAGESAIGVLQGARNEREQVVSGLYDAYKATGGQNTAIPATKIADALGRVADEIGVENIPPAVLSRLKQFGLLEGKQTKLLTINEADKLNRLINNNNPGRGTPGARALQPIKESLNEALLDIPETGASEALLKARRSAADMFAQDRVSKGVSAAIEDVAPDKFVKRFILDAPDRDVRATLAQIKKSPDGEKAISDIKGHLFDSFLMQATGTKDPYELAYKLAQGEAGFSGKAFADAIGKIQPEKLHAIFSPAELDSIRTLQRASYNLTREPRFTDANNSKTGIYLMNMLQRLGTTPMIGKMFSALSGGGNMVIDMAKNAEQRKAAAEMLLTSAAEGAAKKALPAPVAAAKFVPGALAAVSQQPDNADQ